MPTNFSRAQRSSIAPAGTECYRDGYFSDFPPLRWKRPNGWPIAAIGLIGMDTPTPSQHAKEMHWILLKAGVEIVIVEGLTHLESLPNGSRFQCFR